MKKKTFTVLQLSKLYIGEKYPSLQIGNMLFIAENTRVNRIRMKLLNFLLRLLPTPLIAVQILPSESDSRDLALLHRLGVQPFPDDEKLCQGIFPSESETANLLETQEQQRELQAPYSGREHGKQ